MLFTRCPECDTTFRVTDETLKKASGQVRCGRCASVFNAYAELHDPTAKSFEAEPPTRAPVERPPAEPPPSTPPPSGALRGDPPPVATPTAAAAPKPEPADAAAISIASVADVVAKTELAAKTASAPTEPEASASQSDAQAITATEVERVLMADVAAPIPLTAYVWAESDAAPPRGTGRWWSAAAVLALITLGAQALHHFRSDVANHATFGPWLTATYRAFGLELAPSFDVQQYEIIDWVATAEPNARGLGSLRITARIQNRGPQRQPYPAVQLRLKDRWEEAVGSRTFSPAEYLPRAFIAAARGGHREPVAAFVPVRARTELNQDLSRPKLTGFPTCAQWSSSHRGLVIDTSHAHWDRVEGGRSDLNHSSYSAWAR